MRRKKFPPLANSAFVRTATSRRTASLIPGRSVGTVALFLSIFTAGASARGESMTATVKVVSLAPARVRVEGQRSTASKAWSFRNSYASANNLAARLEDLSLRDAAGAPVSARRLAPGEFESERAATAFSYQLKLDPPAAAPDAAHVSWLAGDYGVLLPGDLLPLRTGSASLRLSLPSGWSAATAETPTSDGSYALRDAESAVFFIGRGLRQRRALRPDSSELSFVTTGDWAYTDEEAATAAGKVFEQHAKIFGGAPPGQSLLILAPFPNPVAAQVWSAETRGRTVLLLSGRWPSKVAGLAHLSVPLTHELLHLWVPNGLALDGEYDWFYEGFTLYQALRVGVRLGHFTFRDYLNALGRAFDSYRAVSGTAELSLVEASRRRWSGGAGLVYDKGMLLAFLYDLMLRSQSSGKLTLDDAYRELFRRHKSTSARSDGNKAVVTVLSDTGGMRSYTERYVQGNSPLDLRAALAPFGLQTSSVGARTLVTVSDSLSKSQRDLLRKLGYNEK